MSICILTIRVKYFSDGSKEYTPLTQSHVDTFISFYAHSVTVYSRFPPVCCWAVSCTRCRCHVVGMQVDCHVLRNPDGLGLCVLCAALCAPSDGLGVRPCNRPACICWACPGGCGGSCGRPMPYTHSGKAAASSSRSAPALLPSCVPGFGRFRLHLHVHSTFAGGTLGGLVVWKSWRVTLPNSRRK